MNDGLPAGFELDGRSNATSSASVPSTGTSVLKAPNGFVLDRGSAPAAPPPAAADTSTHFMDYPKALAAGAVEGVGSAVSGLGSLAKLVSPAHYSETLARAEGVSPDVQKAAGVFQDVADAPANALQWVGNKISQGGQAIAGTESEGAQQAAAKPVVQGSLLHPSTWQLGAGATDPRSLALKGLGLVGNLAPMLVAPEAAGARALGAAGKAGEAAETAVNGIRAGMKVSEMAPEVAAQVPAILKSVGRVKQATGAAAGGVQMAEGAAQGEQARIEQMQPDELAQLPAYQQAIAAGQTPDEARATVAQHAHDASFAASIGPSLAMGYLSTVPLLNRTQGVLAKTVGTSRLKRAVAGAALEAPVQGAAFAGQNAASIAATNLATGEQRSPLEDSAATFGSGALMGGFFGAAGAALHRPAPFPDAKPGSLADAANVLHRNAPPEPPPVVTPDTTAAPQPEPIAPTQAAAEPAAAAPAAEGTGGTRRVPPIDVPWVDKSTGTVTPPSDDQVLLALHNMGDIADTATANGFRPTLNTKQIANAWGLTDARTKDLMTQYRAERKRGVTTTDAQARLDQAQAQAPAAEAAVPADADVAAAAPESVVDSAPTETPTPVGQPWPQPDWVDTNTGELRPPTNDELKAQLHALADVHSNLSDAFLANVWHVDADRIAALRNDVAAERANGTDTVGAFARVDAERQAADASPDNAAANTAAEAEPAAATPAPDEPKAETSAAQPGATETPVNVDGQAAETPQPASTPRPDASVPAAAEPASAAKPVAPEPAPVAEPVAAPEAGVPAARAEATSVPADQAAREVPVSSSETSDKSGVTTETTPNVGETQTTNVEHATHSQAMTAETPIPSATVTANTRGANVVTAQQTTNPGSFAAAWDAMKPADRRRIANAAKIGRSVDRARIAQSTWAGLSAGHLSAHFPGVRDTLRDAFAAHGGRRSTNLAETTVKEPNARASAQEGGAVEAVVAPGDRVTVTRGVHAGKVASVVGRTRSGVRLKFEDGTQATLSAKVMKRVESGATRVPAPGEVEQTAAHVAQTAENLRNSVKLAHEVLNDPHTPDSRKPAIREQIGKLEAVQYRHLAATKDGNPDYYNADLAKELDPEYSRNNEARLENNSKVGPAAAKIAHDAFAARLKEPAVGADERVYLMGGGTGSGKSSLKPDHGIIYDSTQFDPALAERDVRMVLDSGRQVNERYVFSDPIDAFRAMLTRMRERGRPVRMATFLRTHEGAYKTIQRLMQVFKDDPRVHFELFDNTGHAKKPIESLPAYDYNGLEPKLRTILDAEYSEGHVNAAEYKAVAGEAPSAAARQQGTPVSHGGNGAAGLPVSSESIRHGTTQGLVNPETPPKGGVSASGKAKPAAPKKATAIEDFGEKLGGARKDQVPSLHTELGDSDIRAQPLSKIWPASEVDAITDPFASAVAYATRAEIPAKPRTSYKLSHWVEKVQNARELARLAVDGKLTPEMLAGRVGLKDFAAKVALLQKLDRAQWGRIGDVREQAGAFAYGPDGEHIPKPRVVVQIDGRWETFDGAKTVDDALNGVKDRLGVGVAAKPLQFEIRGDRKKNEYFINKKGDGEYRHLKEFTDLAEARAYLKANHADLVKAWDAVKDRDNVTKADMRNTQNRDRVGPDYREGKDVSPEQFGENFGFRGVEFGNWVKQGGNAKERQGLLNQAYDALMDLANIIGVPPRAMSLDGSLGLGLGSRGHGRASAHFESDRLVINLTKTRGAGALAHEWFHALDNYFARSRGVPADKGGQQGRREGAFVTYRPEPMLINPDVPGAGRMTRVELARRHELHPDAKLYDPANWKADPNHPAGVRPVVEKAFAELVNALNASPMHKRALSIDNGKESGYWSRIIERAARSFENYVIARMDSKGLSNDYLANVRQLEKFNRNPERYPYLRPEEVKPVAEAFDNLFATLETRQGENGNVALFSRGTSPDGMDRDQLGRLVASTKRGWGKNQPDVAVVDNAEGLPAEAKRDPGYQRAEGYYDGKKVWLVASNLPNAARARQVLAHEAVGHYGVDRIVQEAYGKDAWDKVTQSVTRLDREGLGGKAMQDVLAETHRRYPDADATTFAKEAIAVMAEHGIRNGIIDRVVVAVRQYLRKIMPNLDLSAAEVRQLLARSERLLGDGAARAQREQVRMVAAHAFDKAPDTFYSALTEAVARGKGAPKKADAAAWKQWLDGAQRRGEFKGAEREWMGLDPWLDEHKGPVTRAELNDFVRENRVHVQEVMHGDEPPIDAADIRENADGGFDLVNDAGELATAPELPTTFGEYTLPGGKNYRELLLTLPQRDALTSGERAELGALTERKQAAELERPGVKPLSAEETTRLAALQDKAIVGNKAPFHSGHFDEPNIVAHVRFNDRTGPGGEKILHVEEVQSDWHQIGRKHGYGKRAPIDVSGWRAEPEPGGETWEVYAADGEHILTVEARNANDAIAETARFDYAEFSGVPDAPFKKTEQWSMLAMKRVLRYAADHGYDKVTWTTGEQQAERYDLSKHVSRASYMDGRLMVRDKAGGVLYNEKTPEADIAGVIGKDAAARLLAAPEHDMSLQAGQVGAKGREITGDGLKMGGDGMRAFYDHMLPNELNKYAKQWGAKVGETAVETRPARELRNEMDLTDLGEPAARDNNTHTEPAQTATVHSIDITPAMRESVQQGQPMFARPEPPTLFKPDADEATRFRDDLRATMADRRTTVPPIRLGETSAVLRALGAKDLPIDISRDTVRKATNGVKHVVPMDVIERLPEELHDPLAVFKSRTHPDSLVVLTEYRDAKGSPVVVALDLRALGDKYQVNRIASVYGKDGARPLDMWVKDGMLAYKSNRAERSPVLDGLQLPNRMTGDFGQGKVLTEADVESRLGKPGNGREKLGSSFSKPDPSAPSDPSREPHKTIADIEDVLKQGDPGGVRERVKGWLRGKLEDLRPTLLGALQTGHILELMEDVPALKGAGRHYNELMHQMAADREHLMVGAPDAKDHPTDMLKKGAVTIANEVRNFTYGRGLGALRGKVRPEAKKLFDLMHQATLQRMDPAEVYERLTIENAHGDAVPWTHESVKARLKLLRELALQRGGDPWADREKLHDEIKYLRNIAKMERKRERNWPKLQADWMALPEEAKRLYKEMRDWHKAYRDETEKALIKNIEALDVPETYRRGLVQRMRMQFESARREGVYFPLNRDGDYWIAFQDREGNEGFKMFETARDFARGAARLRAAGFQIDAKGRRDNNMKARQAPSGTFVRQVIDALQKAKVSETVQDEVYQTFLRSLPELSMRKHSIHRRNIAGFNEDALRAFAKNGYHGAYQLARLRHAQDMEFALEGMKASVDNWRRGENATDAMTEPSGLTVAKADALVAEMQKRHDWIMHPSDQQLANMVNSLGFVWYLGASPASALTNLTQIAQTTLPALGAAHGFPKAAKYLAAAWRDAARTMGNMDRTLTNPEERRAFLVMQQRGDFSKTQSHTLAGLAEGNALQSSPAWSRVMNGVSWMFHTSEVINREATGMAAYRLARAEGKTFNDAVEYAGKVNADTMFDYSSANRPRYMQGNVQRIALQFKNYSIGMSWLFYRNLYQSMKAADPETRRVARRTVTGILGMTAILAGATGLPIYNTVRTAANAANALWGDDDEPWNFDDAFHRWLADNLGQDAARMIAEGPSNYLTGANIASRTSMSNLWIHDDDQRLEGADAYHALLESLAGPIGGITNNFYVGAEDIRRGRVERGVERMLPSAAKNSIKALRYAHEGVNSLRGDPIVPDISGWEQFIQAIGFQPADVANQYRINTAAKNFIGELGDRKINLMNAYAMAIKSGDPDDRQMALGKITAFNQAHPEMGISAATLRRSLQQRARLSAQATNGVVLNRKLTAQALEFAGAGQ